MTSPPVIHKRLAARLREHAVAARALDAGKAADYIEALAALLEGDSDAVRRVARDLSEIAARFTDPGLHPVARVWTAAADDARHPQRLRRPPSSPTGFGALPPAERRRIQRLGIRARRALPTEERCASAQKGVATRSARGTQQRGERHPARKLLDAQVVEMRQLWAGGTGLSRTELAARFQVTTERVAQIVRGAARAEAR